MFVSIRAASASGCHGLALKLLVNCHIAGAEGVGTRTAVAQTSALTGRICRIVTYARPAYDTQNGSDFYDWSGAGVIREESEW